MANLLAGARLALSTFTIAPVRPGRIDRAAASVAMALAPLVGTALGALLGLLLWGLIAAGTPVPLAAALTVTAAIAATRGLHLDGLADTADGLASYRPAAQALEVMKRSDIGPFGVIAIVLAVLLPVTALTALAADRPGPRLVGTLAIAYAAGRLAATVACVRGIPAARPDGMGAVVAGTVPAPVALGWLLAITVAGRAALSGNPWPGTVSVLCAVGLAGLLLWHVTRRLGGITGDVIGAAIELTTTAALIGLAL